MSLNFYFWAVARCGCKLMPENQIFLARLDRDDKKPPWPNSKRSGKGINITS